MRINYNMSAVITNNQLLRTENALAASMERLSSGLKINHASDNPAGMAISGRMKAQIDGLDQASNNSSDGISVLQTADGALGEVTNMLQRMRELSVQAANGVNSQSEKIAIQQEIESLKQEVDRVASSTEFNTKNLLDGSLDARVYSDDVTRIYASSAVTQGNYKYEVKTAATQAEYAPGTRPFTNPGGWEIADTEEGVVSINGYSIEFREGMTVEEVYEALRKGAEIGETTISDMGDPLKITSTAYGADAQVEIQVSNLALAARLGLQPGLSDGRAFSTGANADIKLDKNGSEFGSQATVKYEGNKITISDVGGFEMSMMLEADFTGDVDLNVTDVGMMTLQVGANEGQQIDVRIPATDTKSLYIDELDVTTVDGAGRAISQLDYAISRVTSVRSQIGAYQNRLEYTVSSLDASHENMNAAISRLEDVDMAEEMVEYTKDNVLAQASTSALAQANELPQMALQLLQ